PRSWRARCAGLCGVGQECVFGFDPVAVRRAVVYQDAEDRRRRLIVAEYPGAAEGGAGREQAERLGGSEPRDRMPMVLRVIHQRDARVIRPGEVSRAIELAGVIAPTGAVSVHGLERVAAFAVEQLSGGTDHRPEAAITEAGTGCGGVQDAILAHRRPDGGPVQ